MPVLGRGRLKDKVAVVTGAGNGIGRATALLFAEEGCSLVLADRDEVAGEAVAAFARSRGSRALFVPCDVSSEESVAALVAAAAAEFGGQLNILVNCAGVNIIARVTDTELERWDRAQHVNLRSVFLTCRACLPHMIECGPGASIVNVSSVQGTRGVPSFPAYAASKAGMQGLSRQMAVDYAQYGVRINCVSPGGIATGLNANSQALEPGLPPKLKPGSGDLAQLERESGTVVPLEHDPTPRLFVQGLPIDCAYSILFLASEESAHTTGQNIMVDGGRTIASSPANVPGITA
jgi:NAD(P)-dependent dehydrogenase (short-subunit alcohol dehydrogenase family)